MYGLRAGLRAWIYGILTLPLVFPRTVAGNLRRAAQSVAIARCMAIEPDPLLLAFEHDRSAA